MATRTTTLLLTSGILILGACSEPELEVEIKPRPVRTIVVQANTESVPSVIAGVARAGVESNLSFRVPGTVIALPAIVGQRVRRGQLLGRLDAVDYELGVEEAKASEAQAEATLRQAIADYSRVRALYENKNASRSDLDAGRAGFESAEAQVEAAQKRLAQAEQQVGYTTLRAPAAGTVAAVGVEVNETVSGGQPIVRLTSGETPEVEVGVAEVTIPFIRQGMEVSVRFDALPGETLTGKVTEVGVDTNPGSSTYSVIVQLDPTTVAIRSGMAAEVRFEIETPGGEHRVILPSVAVGEDEQGRFVFLLEDRGDGLGVVRRHPVRVGSLTRNGIEVLEGVTIGNVVVTAGVRRLNDGMQVRYTPDEGSPWM